MFAWYWVADLCAKSKSCVADRMPLLSLRRVARPDAEQKHILAALKLELPERLIPDRRRPWICASA